MDTVLDLAKAMLLLGGGFMVFVVLAAIIACCFERSFPDPPFTPVLPIGERQDDGTMVLKMELDAIDYRDIQRAITRRQLRRNWPRDSETLDGVSDLPGLAVTEICREWLRQNANVIS